MNDERVERRCDRAFRNQAQSEIMAQQMVRRLGCTEAKRICIENSWTDVLMMINMNRS